MIKSYFKLAFRNIQKNRLYSAINVFGLALGVACCLVIFVVVKYETSFDSYHEKADRIHRVNLYQELPGGGRIFNGCNYDPLADAIRAEVTGLEAVTGVFCLQAYQASQGQKLFKGKYAFFADQDYFNVFDVTWIAGAQKTALTFKNTAVVTDEFADNFLGGQRNALGSTFVLENRLTLTVTGVVQRPPSNTDHPYSLLISYPSLAEFYPNTVDNWKNVNSGASYVVFDENTQRDQISRQLDKIVKKHLPHEIASGTTFYLLPLNDNHDRNYDYTSFTYDFPVPIMFILSVMAAMIAFIACINFVNLATAQSLKRAKEIGLRKTMGSSRLNLLFQFLSEAFVVTLGAVVAGIIMADVAMMYLNKMYGGSYLHFNFTTDPSIFVFIFGVIIVISVLSGFYPAFVLSGFNPVAALKAQVFSGKSGGITLRRSLVVLQFAAAQILIAVTFIMINQIAHFKNRPLSYNPETILIVPHLRGNDNNQFDKFSAALNQMPGVINYTFGNVGNTRITFGKFGGGDAAAGLGSYIDTSYFHTFNAQFLAGRNFVYNKEGNASEVVVNESLVNALGLNSAGQAINFMFLIDNREMVIRGVVADSYTDPFSSKIDPVVFIYDPSKFSSAAITVSTSGIPGTLERIEHAWKEVYPGFLMDYNFMDDVLDREYGFYGIIYNFLGAASLLAIFIGCLGLYGLISFMAVQRTKEIGIRKIFGAKVSNIMGLFTKESALLVTASFTVSAPAAYFTGLAFLTEFPEKIAPGLTVFFLTLLISLAIALVTVSYRSFIAANQNPAHSLRSE